MLVCMCRRYPLNSWLAVSKRSCASRGASTCCRWCAFHWAATSEARPKVNNRVIIICINVYAYACYKYTSALYIYHTVYVHIRIY